MATLAITRPLSATTYGAITQKAITSFLSSQYSSPPQQEFWQVPTFLGTSKTPRKQSPKEPSWQFSSVQQYTSYSGIHSYYTRHINYDRRERLESAPCLKLKNLKVVICSDFRVPKNSKAFFRPENPFLTENKKKSKMMQIFSENFPFQKSRILLKDPKGLCENREKPKGTF